MNTQKKLKALHEYLNICRTLIIELNYETKTDGLFPNILKEVISQIYSFTGRKYNCNKDYSLDFSQYILDYLHQNKAIQHTPNYTPLVRIRFRYNRGKRRWVVYYKPQKTSYTRAYKIEQSKEYFKHQRDVIKLIDPLVNKINLALKNTRDPYALLSGSDMAELNGLWRGIKDFRRMMEYKEDRVKTLVKNNP